MRTLSVLVDIFIYVNLSPPRIALWRECPKSRPNSTCLLWDVRKIRYKKTMSVWFLGFETDARSAAIGACLSGRENGRLIDADINPVLVRIVADEWSWNRCRLGEIVYKSSRWVIVLWFLSRFVFLRMRLKTYGSKIPLVEEICTRVIIWWIQDVYSFCWAQDRQEKSYGPHDWATELDLDQSWKIEEYTSDTKGRDGHP